MRVSTSMIYDKALVQMQAQSANLLKTQQQISSGRRILTPADDPIAAARSLEVRQSQAVNAQFLTNQKNADDRLRTVENRLTGVGEILQYARERAVQVGNAALSDEDLSYIATDMRGQFEALLGLANSRDAQGDYVFAGFMTQTQPFAGGFGAISYEGDDNQLGVQVSASRVMPVSFAGSDVFGSARLPDAPVSVIGARKNVGGATLSLSSSSVAPDQGIRYEVGFDGTDYSVTRRVPGMDDEVLAVVFDAGPPESITFDDGVVLEIDGVPEAGDAFEVFVASRDIFANFAVFIDAIERPGAANVADGAVAFGLNTFDRGLESVLRVRAQIGSQLVEVDNLGNVGDDLNLQYASTLSRLEDLDLAEAISRLSQQQLFLEAAQQSFLRVTGLSLFNYLS